MSNPALESLYEEPAFVVTDVAGRRYVVYASGRTEGFEDMERRCVFNRIPALVSAARALGHRDCMDANAK